MKLATFIEASKNTFQQNLMAAVLYGEGVNSSTKPRGGYELMLLLQDIQPQKLLIGAQFIQKWIAAGNPEPLLIDPHHIQSSLDVFPMEFSGIKANHQVLAGTFDSSVIQINPQELRLQCERELKTKILILRERLVALYPHTKKLTALVINSFPDFLRIFKSTAGLLEMSYTTPESLLSAVTQKAEAESSYIIEAYQAFTTQQELSSKQMDDFFTGYLTSLEKVANLLDRL